MGALHQLMEDALRTISLYLSLLYYLALFNLPRAINSINDMSSSLINFLPTKRLLKQHSHPAPNSDQETRPSSSADYECAVCLSVLHHKPKDDEVPVDRGVRQLLCGHAFHDNCLHTWLTLGSSTCPLCRHPLSPSPGKALGLRGAWGPFYGQDLEVDDSCFDDDHFFPFLDC